MNHKMRRAEKRKNIGHTGSAPRLGGNESHPIAMPDVVALRFAEAVRCQQSGQLAEAVALYDRILRLKPNLAAVYNNRGVALAELRRFDEAEASYRRVIALDPKFPDAYNNLGNALCELGKPGDGELALRQAIELRPDGRAIN
jgi:Flp pilus assembly protein TadD